MNTPEAMKALLEGKKIKYHTWGKGMYIKRDRDDILYVTCVVPRNQTDISYFSFPSEINATTLEDEKLWQLYEGDWDKEYTELMGAKTLDEAKEIEKSNIGCLKRIKKEKKYLENLIEPFMNRKIGIEKKKRNGFVEITMIVSPIIPYQGIPDAFTLPAFSGSTFDWILEGHLHTPEELGLFKEENKK